MRGRALGTGGRPMVMVTTPWVLPPRPSLGATDTVQVVVGQSLPGEKQDLNFVNAGVTYHW